MHKDSPAAMNTLHPNQASTISVLQKVIHLWHLLTLPTTLLIACGNARCTAIVAATITAMAINRNRIMLP